MANAFIDDNYLSDIADAIRAKTQTSGAMTVPEMPEKIMSIPTGSGTVQPKTVTLSGSQQIVRPDQNYDALSQVTVPGVVGNATASDVLAAKTFSSASNPTGATGSIQTKSASSETISAAKSYDAGYYPSGWTVTPSGGTTDLQAKTATLRGVDGGTVSDVITPDQGYDGLSQVTVPRVSGTATASDVLASATFSSATNPTGATGGIQTKSASSETISAAKSYDAGYYPSGWTVTPQSASLMTKTFAQNGTYVARTEDNVDGYSTVTVDVQTAPGGNLPSRIYVSVPPTKTSYVIGDTIDLTGMVVKAVWADGTETDVTSSIITTPANGETISIIISKINIKYVYSWTGAEAVYTTSQAITVPAPAQIYGVSWTVGSNPVLTRTDDAAQFSNPSAAVSTGSGSSPFDSILPWSGMTRVTHPTAGEVVAIPKYYYKMTETGNSAFGVQISASKFSGSYVSPAHMDRGDGKGERDVVYVGRYHCGNNYRSESGVLPAVQKTRAQFRQNIHALDTTVWQWDYAMYQTIFMLYLVEYATWYSQNVIGRGCGSGSALYANGNTDSMLYHTGTAAASLSTYGDIQYRNIEGLWSCVRDFVDGVYCASTYIYFIQNPSLFSDNQNGVRPYYFNSNKSGEIDRWTIFNTESLLEEFGQLAFPSDVTVTTGGQYCCSKYIYYANDTIGNAGVLEQGGYYDNKDINYGLFAMKLGQHTANQSLIDTGSRLMILP